MISLAQTKLTKDEHRWRKMKVQFENDDVNIRLHRSYALSRSGYLRLGIPKEDHPSFQSTAKC